VVPWSLSRIRGFRHASDDALTFLALVGPEASPVRLTDHLGVCRQCALRLQDIAEALAADRRQVATEHDQEFTPARLERQRASVLRRLGGSKAAARILPFPAHGPVTPAVPGRHFMRRSVAAAAVGGLIVGGAAGRLLDPHRQPAFRPAPAETRTLAPEDGVQTVRVATFSEEAFLGEFEAAIGAPRIEPLRALDALTPQAADDPIVR
jgi:hypothetical protein